MEDIKQYVIANWPAIVEVAMMFLAYFLVFLYRAKVGSTRRDLTVMFKEEAHGVRLTDRKLREDIGEVRKTIEEELAESKHNYQKAVDEIYDLRNRLTKAECAIEELITEEVIDDGEQNTTEVSGDVSTTEKE